ncbi:unnamed protein product, partial [Laminaria digitata]
QRWASLDRHRTSERQRLGLLDRYRLSLPEQLHLESLYDRHLGPPERQLRHHRQGPTDQQRLLHPGSHQLLLRYAFKPSSILRPTASWRRFTRSWQRKDNHGQAPRQDLWTSHTVAKNQC